MGKQISYLVMTLYLLIAPLISSTVFAHECPVGFVCRTDEDCIRSGCGAHCSNKYTGLPTGGCAPELKNEVARPCLELQRFCYKSIVKDMIVSQKKIPPIPVKDIEKCVEGHTASWQTCKMSEFCSSSYEFLASYPNGQEFTLYPTCYKDGGGVYSVHARCVSPLAEPQYKSSDTWCSYNKDWYSFSYIYYGKGLPTQNILFCNDEPVLEEVTIEDKNYISQDEKGCYINEDGDTTFVPNGKYAEYPTDSCHDLSALNFENGQFCLRDVLTPNSMNISGGMPNKTDFCKLNIMMKCK